MMEGALASRWGTRQDAAGPGGVRIMAEPGGTRTSLTRRDVPISDTRHGARFSTPAMPRMWSSVLVDVFSDDDPEHRLIAEASFGASRAEALDELSIEQDRRRLARTSAKHFPSTTRADIVTRIFGVELQSLSVPLSL